MWLLAHPGTFSCLPVFVWDTVSMDVLVVSTMYVKRCVEQGAGLGSE